MLAIQTVDDILKPGIYLLTFRGRVVFVARAKCLLTVVAEHRVLLGKASAPSWHPLRRVQFDGIQIIPCAADRAAELLPALIDLYAPRYNVSPIPAGATTETSTVPPTSDLSAVLAPHLPPPRPTRRL